MDLSSSHPRVMLMAQHHPLPLHISPNHQQQRHTIVKSAFGNPCDISTVPASSALALKSSKSTLDSFADKDDDDEHERDNPFLRLSTTSSSSSEAEEDQEQVVDCLIVGQDDDNDDPTTKSSRYFSLMSSPRARSVVFMALSMALHFGGYEFARSATLALFTSSGPTGFHTPFAFPLAMAMVTPVSFVLLLWYTNDLQAHGQPRLALRHSTLGSMLILTMAGLALSCLQHFPLQTMLSFGNNDYSLSSLLSQVIVGMVFLFQNSYAHLLYAQQWSFLASVMTPNEGSKWFASIAGLSSIAAACAGRIVSQLVTRIGLIGLLLSTVLALAGSLVCAEQAYAIATKFGFDPADEIALQQQQKGARQEETHHNMVARAKDLFQRVPTLKALFCEVLSFQSLSTILNVCFVTKLRMSIVDDVTRASYTGKLYSLINTVSAAFQFVVLPLTMKRIEPKMVWRIMPLIPVLCSLAQSTQPDPSLSLLAFSFCTAKCMDYSFRSVVNEMVYVPLDFESRYVGKEIIGVFGSRFGKSGMSLLLSALTYTFGNFGLQPLSILSLAASTMWMGTSWWLSDLVPNKARAQEMVDERRNAKDS